MRRNLLCGILLTTALAAAAPAPARAQQSTADQERAQRDRAERSRERAQQQAERDRIRAEARAAASAEAGADADDDADDDNESHGSRGGPSRIDTTVSLGPGATVDLSLMSGEIVVTGWTRGEARVKASTERGVIRFDHSAQRLSLDVEGVRGRPGDTRYELTVPEGTRVLMHSLSGDLTAHGVKGEVEARSISGEVNVSDVVHSLTVETVSGGVTATRLAGDVHGTSVSGDAELTDVTGDVEFSSVSGEVTLSNARSRTVHLGTVSGDLSYQGALDPAGRYEFGTHSGSVRLALPADASAQVGVQTFSGTIESDFPLTLQPAADGARRGARRMEFTLGHGGPRLTAETFSGTITLERGSGRGSK